MTGLEIAGVAVLWAIGVILMCAARWPAEQPIRLPKPRRAAVALERVTLPCEEQTVARTAVAGHPPWSGSHRAMRPVRMTGSGPQAAGALGLAVRPTDPVVTPDLPVPLPDGAPRKSMPVHQSSPVRGGGFHPDVPGTPSFTPSGYRPVQSWNCLMTPPKRRVRPHDHTGEFRAIGARSLPEWAQRMRDCLPGDLAGVVAADVAWCGRLGAAL